MKLISDFFENAFELKFTELNILVIENKQFYRKLIHALKESVSGNESCFKIIENLEEKDLSKMSAFITDVFDININESKIINRIYNLLIEESNGSELYDQKIKFENEINKFIEELIFKFDYDITYDHIDYKNIFKGVNLHIEDNFQGLMENLLEYIDISYKLLNKKIFFILNLNCYFNSNELEELKRYLCYNNVVVVLLQNRLDLEIQKSENIKIIDSDLDDI